MHLNRNDEDILAGELGAVKQKAMEILVALGDIYEAERLVPIESAQIAGVSYKTIGDAGLEYLTDLTGNVTVPTMLLSLIHISEPTRRTPISYAVFCLTK